MKIFKFGGTSVGSAERMRALAGLVAGGGPKIVVLSAMSGTTDSLVAIAAAARAGRKAAAEKLIGALEKKHRDTAVALYLTGKALRKGLRHIGARFGLIRSLAAGRFGSREERAVLAQGELLSSAMVHYHLEETDAGSVLLSALEFMRLDKDGEPDMPRIRRGARALLAEHPRCRLFITQGYICRNSAGGIDNLKRGGSDYTATILGAAVRAEEIQIWTDIDGMHNNDPRHVKGTRPIAALSFDEAAELAYFGAKILHPTCIRPARDRAIPVRLLNTMRPRAAGTLITGTSTGGGFRAVAAKDGITAIKVKSGRMLLAYGFLRRLFEVFERYRTPIDMITTSEVAVSLTIDDRTNLAPIVRELKAFGAVEVDEGQSIICVVGRFAAEQKGRALRIFEALRGIPIRMISYGGSESNVSVLVAARLKKKALQALHSVLFGKGRIAGP